MNYRYLENFATADVAFEAWGETKEEMFAAAVDATLNVMVDDLDSVADREHITIHAEADAVDLLLLRLLQEVVYYKDAEQLLLRAVTVRIEQRGEDDFVLEAEACGETIDPDRHELHVDVKAVTLHHFQVERTAQGWMARVVLDI